MSAQIVFAEQKTFVREYYYQASETDSKVTAREKSLTEVKRLLLEELGVYMESYVNYTVESSGPAISKDFIHNEIKQISAGITETKILEENWNGVQYYIKAEISADPTEVVRSINKTLEKRRSDVVIDSLQVLLSSTQKNIDAKNEEIKLLSSKLLSQQQITDEQNAKVISLNAKLLALQQQLTEYKREEQVLLNDIERIKSNLRNITQKTVNNAKIGMTTAEVKQLCGMPRQTATFMDVTFYNYGYIWLIFENGILMRGIKIEDYNGTQRNYKYSENQISR